MFISRKIVFNNVEPLPRVQQLPIIVNSVQIRYQLVCIWKLHGHGSCGCHIYEQVLQVFAQFFAQKLPMVHKCFFPLKKRHRSDLKHFLTFLSNQTCQRFQLILDA